MLAIYGTEPLAGLPESHRGGTTCTVPASRTLMCPCGAPLLRRRVHFSVICGNSQVASVNVMFPEMEEGFAVLWEPGLATPGGLIGKVFDFNGRREIGQCILSRQDEGGKAVIDRDPIGDERPGAMVALNI